MDTDLILLFPAILSALIATNYGNSYLKLFKNKKNISAPTSPLEVVGDPFGFLTRGATLEFYILRNIYKKHADQDLEKARIKFISWMIISFVGFIAGSLILIFSA